CRGSPPKAHAASRGRLRPRYFARFHRSAARPSSATWGARTATAARSRNARPSRLPYRAPRPRRSPRSRSHAVRRKRSAAACRCRTGRRSALPRSRRPPPATRSEPSAYRHWAATGECAAVHRAPARRRNKPFDGKSSAASEKPVIVGNLVAQPVVAADEIAQEFVKAAVEDGGDAARLQLRPDVRQRAVAVMALAIVFGEEIKA